MKVDLAKEHSVPRPADPIAVEPAGRGPRWPIVAAAVAVVALVIAGFAAFHGQGVVRENGRAVFMDPMTGLREGGPYDTPHARHFTRGQVALINANLAARMRSLKAVGTSAPQSGRYVGPMTGLREGGTYKQTQVGLWVDPMTRFREGGMYSTAGATSC